MPTEKVPFLLVRFLWANKENEHKNNSSLSYKLPMLLLFLLPWEKEKRTESF